MRWNTLATVGALLLLGGNALAASSLPPLGLDEVDFHSRPRADAGFQFYPKEALSARVEGHATAVCTVQASGDLTACAVTEETPPGYGFGAKVLESAQFIRIYSLSKYGAPTKGRLISLPMKFSLPPRT